MNILVWVSQFGSMRNVCQFLKIIVAGRGLWWRSRGGERTRAASGITPRQLKVWANSWVIVAVCVYVQLRAGKLQPCVCSSNRSVNKDTEKHKNRIGSAVVMLQ